MTPPDWLLQLLGGAAVVTLLLLLSTLWRSRPGSKKVKLKPTREQLARLKQQQRKREAHEREVLRPGLIHAAFDRDYVSRGDMEGGWFWHLMMFEHDLPISAVLKTHVRAELPDVPNARVAWLIQLHEQLEAPTKTPGGSIDREGRQRVTDIAVMAPEWDAPRLLRPDFPISRIGNDVLYAHYHSQEDPEVLYETYRERISPRVESTRRSYAYDPSAVDPARRKMVRLPQPSGRSG